MPNAIPRIELGIFGTTTRTHIECNFKHVIIIVCSIGNLIVVFAHF